MIVVKKGKGFQVIKRIFRERLEAMDEVLHYHEEYNTPHTVLSEMFHVPRATIVRWLNRYYVDRAHTAILTIKGEIPTKPKLGCPRKCYICGNPLPASRVSTSFCSRKCEYFYCLRRRIRRLPDYDAFENSIPEFPTMEAGIKWASAFLRDRGINNGPGEKPLSGQQVLLVKQLIRDG